MPDDRPPIEPPVLADVRLRINGTEHALTIDTRTSLLDLLREQLDLTGAKKGCDHGQCGACTILIDGRRANGCLALAVAHDGAEITTVEGLADGDELHPLQRAFIEHDAFQCGYCTPGQLCSAVGMLDEVRHGWPSAVTPGGATARCRMLTDDRDPRADERQPVPLRRVRQHRAGDRRRRGMRPFRYERADDADQAVALLLDDRPRRALLGGGTNLVDLMRLGRRDAARCSSTSHRLGHDGIEETDDGGLRIGAGGDQQRPGRRPARAGRATRSSRRRCCTARRVSCATSRRSAATCSSARAARTSRTSPSRATSASRVAAARRVDGRHHNHAILGHSEQCVATHPSDMAVALAALDATVHVQRPGRRADDPDPRPAPAARRRAPARHGARARRADHRGRARPAT